MVTTQLYNIDDMYAIIRKRILYELYKSGEKLSETQLAKEFNCSRTPIRETLKRLEQDGLVVIQPKSGSYIKERSSKENLDAIEVRAYIEGLAVRLALANKTDTAQLETIVDKMDSVLNSMPVDIVAFGDLHYEFHSTLVALSGNEQCNVLYEKLNLRSSMTFFYQNMSKSVSEFTQNEHKKIIQLLAAGDKRAEKFTIEHLWKKRNRMLENDNPLY